MEDYVKIVAFYLHIPEEGRNFVEIPAHGSFRSSRILPNKFHRPFDIGRKDIPEGIQVPAKIFREVEFSGDLTVEFV
jgi:hypothetical protein